LREVNLGSYLISLFLIMFIDRMKKKGVVTRNQTRLSSRVTLSPPAVSALASVTACVNGNKMLAIVCACTGRAVMGKKVPLKMNIGVMKRKAG